MRDLGARRHPPDRVNLNLIDHGGPLHVDENDSLASLKDAGELSLQTPQGAANVSGDSR